MNQTKYKILIAAALFGASAPFAKLLLSEIDPVLLASFLYLGSGIGLVFYKFIQRIGLKEASKEAGLNKNDLPWLLGAIIAGGIAAPIVLMFSLRVTPAATASLLFNFEAVATALIAALVFKEAVDRRFWWAVACITIASILLTLEIKGKWGFSFGALGVLVACILWGIDNALARNISAKDPIIIVVIKGLSAGSFSLVLAVIMGNRFPDILIIILAMIIGLFCYGLSIVLFILAMRDLGAARTSAYFGTAPFIGAVLSFLIFRESPNTQFFISLPIMISGAILLLKEKHEHLHQHLAIEHDHGHRHNDLHHIHEHQNVIVDHKETHSHLHKHDPITHEHPHTPDIHHRHVHKQNDVAN